MALKGPPTGPRTNVAAIAGGTVGGVAAVALGLLGSMVLRRRRQKRSQFLPKPVELPSTVPKTLGGGGSPAELMEHSQVNRGRPCAWELPAEEVARDAGP